VGIRPRRAKIPPSPLLSASRIKTTYLILITMVSDQKIRERVPRRFALVSAMA